MRGKAVEETEVFQCLCTAQSDRYTKFLTELKNSNRACCLEKQRSLSSSNLCGHGRGLSEGWASLRVLGRQACHVTEGLPPSPSSTCRFSLNSIFGPVPHPHPPQGPPRCKASSKSPRLHPRGVARGQVGPGGQGNLAVSHRDLESVPALLSAPNLAFHGEPLQGSWG